MSTISSGAASSTTVSAYEAKTHLSSLLDRAEAGDAIVITRHGRAVARLVGVDSRPRIDDAVADLRAFRASLGPDPIDVRTLIDEGRRY